MFNHNCRETMPRYDWPVLDRDPKKTGSRAPPMFTAIFIGCSEISDRSHFL